MNRWTNIYNQVPLSEVPRHFDSIKQSRFLTEYLLTILRHCPRGGRTCETGVGSGYGAIWLSLRGISAEGIDNAPTIIERARHINNILGGQASFSEGDIFDFYQKIYDQVRYDVIHHQGVLEHFTAPQIRAALAQQVASSNFVVFSVPSVYYPFDGEFGDERFLPLDEWERILSPLNIVELKYYGDPQHGEREHILCVLKGQEVTTELEQLMEIPAEPYPQGISAIVHTRNEARHIEECLQTLQGWTDEIILCDMESSDDTVERAKQFTSTIIEHPYISNFDRARNVSAMRAEYRWIFYLDADERVPPALGAALREMALKDESTFEALLIPFRHHFSSHWMRSLYPGYTMPRLYKNGRFSFNSRLHAGAQVEGRTVCFPANDPALALVHYSYDDIHHYLTKMNRYTDGEAANLQRDGATFHWQNAIRHWVQDVHSYYDVQRAHQDGPHGLIYSWMSGYYRFIQHAKLYEKHFHAGQVNPAETAVPANVEEMLEYALSVLREKPLPQMEPIKIQDAQKAEAAISENSSMPSVVWSGPLHNLSGYGEESRHFLLGMKETGIDVAGQIIPWSNSENDDPIAERGQIDALTQKTVSPGFIHITEDFPQNFTRHPQAKVSIGRTMFETDRLPVSWINACNRMDYIWVPSEFNRTTFAAAGVEENKLVVIPGCFDTRPFQELKPRPASRKISSSKPFRFISLFDWTQHKGWDVLLKAFLEVFENRKDVVLALKVWSTMGYSMDTIKQQAEEFVLHNTGYASLKEAPIEWIEEKLSAAELLHFYTEADAFVLPSRGEGWGRPYMEAMACGLPVIGTGWSGNTTFMKSDNSYLIDYQIKPVPKSRPIADISGQSPMRHIWDESYNI